jgi:chemotaxis protein MotB
MNRTYLSIIAMMLIVLSSCVSKKKFTALETDLKTANEQLGKCGESLNDYMARLTTCTSDPA